VPRTLVVPQHSDHASSVHRPHTSRAPGHRGLPKAEGLGQLAGPRPCQHWESWAALSPHAQSFFPFPIRFSYRISIQILFRLNLFKFCSDLEFE
jgi:hypothetical protein